MKAVLQLIRVYQCFYQQHLRTDCSRNTALLTRLFLPPKSKCREKNKTREFCLTLNTLSMPGLHELLFKNWVPAETEDLTLQSDPVLSSYISFHLFTWFSFLHSLLLCITCLYPPAIQFDFELCKMFSLLTAMSYHLSVQPCSRPQTPWRTQTLQEKWDFFDATEMGGVKWPRHPLKPPHFSQDASFPSVLFAANSQGHEAVLKSWVFSF